MKIWISYILRHYHTVSQNPPLRVAFTSFRLSGAAALILRFYGCVPASDLVAQELLYVILDLESLMKSDS